MKKFNLKSFAMGVVTTALLLPVVAVASELVTINVIPGIHVNVNGQTLNLPAGEDAFIYAGRTFLPVRAVSEALGLEVDWNQVTSTVYLTSPGPAMTTPVPIPAPVPTPAPVEETTPGTADIAALLVGQWAWDFGPEFIYTFNANGTGTRGVEGIMENFNWSVVDGNNLLLEMDPATTVQIYMTESWTATIVDDVLTIESRQVQGMVFSYVWIG